MRPRPAHAASDGGKVHWVSVINPSAKTFEAVKPLLVEARNLAVEKDTRE
jgi:predicted DNA-binding protein (MmcQ/YjbR family)